MRGFTSTGVFCLWINLTIGIIIELIPPDPLVNQSVLLGVTQMDSPVRSFTWYKGENIKSQNKILSFTKRSHPEETFGPLYSSRFSSFPNASLKISNLHIEDQGNYTVQVLLDAPVRSTVQLLVHVLVTKPIIRSSTLYAIGDQTVTLTCETMNFEKIRWGRSGKRLPSGVIWSYDNRVITFLNIKSLDAGLYWCEAENVISKMTSDIYPLNVYCICGSASELNAGEISGIIVGTILGLVLLAGGISIFLSIKRQKNSAQEDSREEANKNYDSPIEYYNVQAMTTPDPTNQEPTYIDLQYPSQDAYSDLQN